MVIQKFTGKLTSFIKCRYFIFEICFSLYRTTCKSTCYFSCLLVVKYGPQQPNHGITIAPGSLLLVNCINCTTMDTGDKGVCSFSVVQICCWKCIYFTSSKSVNCDNAGTTETNYCSFCHSIVYELPKFQLLDSIQQCLWKDSITSPQIYSPKLPYCVGSVRDMVVVLYMLIKYKLSSKNKF